MKNTNLQDIFLDRARALAVPMTVNLTNGFQVKGTVTGFDSFTVVMDCDDRQTLIYKHAVVSIIPAKPVKIDFQSAPEQD